MSTNWYWGRALKALKKAISPPNRIKFSTVVLSVLFATSTTYAITQAEVEAIGNAKGTIVDGGLNANTDRELIYNAGIINAYYLKNLAREPDNPAINGSAVLWIEGDTGIYRVENSVFQGNRSGPHLNHGKSGVISKRGASTLEIKDSIFFGNFGGNNRDLEVSGLGHGSAVLDNYNADSISAIEGSNFANNTAGNGAVVHSYGTLYIKDSIFSNNSGQHAYLWNTGTAGVMNILSTGGAVVGDTRTGMILEDSAREFGLRNENILNLNATAGNKIVLTNSTLNNVATVNINPNTTDSNTAKMYNMATSSVEEITTRTTGDRKSVV